MRVADTTDYLGNLIGKSFGRTTPLKPRPASLFAPSPYAAGVLALGELNAPTFEKRTLPFRSLESDPWTELLVERIDDREVQNHGIQHAPFPDTGREDSVGHEPDSLVPGQPIEPAPNPLYRYPSQGTAPFTPASSPVAPIFTDGRRDQALQDQAQSWYEQVSEPGPVSSQMQPETISAHSTSEVTRWQEPPFGSQSKAAPDKEGQRAPAIQHPTQDVTRRGAGSNLASRQPSVDDDFQRLNSLTDALRPDGTQTRAARTSLNASDGIQEHTRTVRRTDTPSESALLPGAVQPHLQQSEQGTSTVANLPGRDKRPDHQAQPSGSLASTIVNQSRLATIRVEVPQGSGDQRTVTAVKRPASEHGSTTPDHIAVSTTSAANGQPPVIRPILQPVRQELSTELISGEARRTAGAGPRSAPPAQPAIHVTIGRIEVRATPAPAPAPRKPATAPVMSLDEYLKMRNGGRR